MLHSWMESTHGNGATTRAVLFDYRKAFDLIDHHVLAQELSSYDFPESIMCWILDFLTNRRHRVKLSCDCVSEWRAVPARVPQGTNLGPWLFLIMINDLMILPSLSVWKKNGTSSMQSRMDEFATKSWAYGFQLNKSKCKELRISFTKSENPLEPITINNTNIEVVPITVLNSAAWFIHLRSRCHSFAYSASLGPYWTEDHF